MMKNASKKSAAKQFGIPRSTLQRYIKECEIDGGVAKKSLGRHTTLTEEQENELSGILQEMEKRLYGLTPLSVRKVVYQFCDLNNISHTFNNETKLAGKKWLRLFLSRHSELSVRKPEGVSIQRALGYNRSKVKIFEDILKKELFHESGQRRIPAENIFNVDETGISVNHRPNKIVAMKGKKSVSIITSAEKGKTITAVCCVSAAGVYCPPFLIFPRKRFKAELLDRGPVGAVGVANPSGWINETIFTQWFDHFLACFQPVHRSSPSLLIMDGHASHTQNLELVNKARANNVELLVLPSHCTHKIQPLDVAVFKSLKTHYYRAVDSWLHAHPGRAVQESNVAELFAEAWGKAATVSNAVSGFEKARINPFKESTSDDEEYLGAEVTDMPHDLEDVMLPQVATTLEPHSQVTNVTEVTTVATNTSENTTETETCKIIKSHSNSTTTTGTCEVANEDNIVLMADPHVLTDCEMQDVNSSVVAISSASTTNTTELQTITNSDSQVKITDENQILDSHVETILDLNTSFHEFISMPKADRSQINRRKRAVAHAKLITLSPYKQRLEDAEKKKNKKSSGKEIRAKDLKPEIRKGQNLSVKKSKKEKMQENTSHNVQMKKKRKVRSVKGENALPDDANCLYCNELYSCSIEPWIRCQGPCLKWSHVSCSGLGPKDDSFICEFCKD